MLVSCSKIGPDSSASEHEASLDFFSMYGEVHNAMLLYIDSNVDLDTICSNEGEALDYLANIQSEYADQLLLPNADKKMIKLLLPKYKRLYNSDNIRLSPSTKGSYDGKENESEYVYTTDDLYKSINESFSMGEIDEFEKNMLIELIDICEKNVIGKLTNDSFNKKFNSLVTRWSKHYSLTDFSLLKDENGNFKNDLTNIPAGAVSGVVLNISRSSLEYWDTAETKVLGTIVVQDIVGAVIGGVSGGIGSAVVGGHWNWGSVAWGAGVGAITGSTGVVGKTAKWIISAIK